MLNKECRFALLIASLCVVASFAIMKCIWVEKNKWKTRKIFFYILHPVIWSLVKILDNVHAAVIIFFCLATHRKKCFWPFYCFYVRFFYLNWNFFPFLLSMTVHTKGEYGSIMKGRFKMRAYSRDVVRKCTFIAMRQQWL